VCWGNLEQFNDFYSFVANNYHVEIKEETKFQIPEVVTDHSDMIVYDDGNDKVESEMIKVEIINDADQFEESTDWLEESPEPVFKKPKRLKIPSIDPPKISRQTTVLDSADDQRIRETVCMACDICNDPLDSLRDAKAHFKVNFMKIGVS
jgi:hypothetical protein